MSRTVLPLPVRDVSAFAKALSRQLSSLGRSPGHLELLNMLARSAGFQNFQHLRDRRDVAGSLVADLAGEFAPASANPGGTPPESVVGPRPGETSGSAVGRDPSALRDLVGGQDIGRPDQPGQADPRGPDQRTRVGAPDEAQAGQPIQAGRPDDVQGGLPVQADRPDDVQAGVPIQTNAPDAARPDQLDPVDERRLKRLLRFFDPSGRMTRWPGKHSQQTDCLWVVWSRLPSGPTGDEAAINARLAALHTFGDHALLRRELYDRGFLDRTPDGRAYRRLERKPAPLALALIRRVGRESIG